jgi:hypothetical protein
VEEVDRERARRVGPWINIYEYSVPVYRVPPCTKTVSVHLDHPDATSLQQALSAVPVPPGARPARGGDGAMAVLQPSSDRMWEFWQMHRADGDWHASWGGAMDHVSHNPGYFHGPGPARAWGATASGLPAMAGLITPEDLRHASINHALAMAMPEVRATQFAAPAQRTDGRIPPPDGIPEGAHLRLDPRLNLDLMHLSPVGLALARAAQRYGIIVVNYSTYTVFFGEDPQGRGGADPWPALLGGVSPDALLAGFPWSRLQILRMQLKSN